MEGEKTELEKVKEWVARAIEAWEAMNKGSFRLFSSEGTTEWWLDTEDFMKMRETMKEGKRWQSS